MKNLVKGKMILNYERELEKLNFVPEQIGHVEQSNMYMRLRSIMKKAAQLRGLIDQFNNEFKNHTYIENYFIPDSSWGTDGIPLEETWQSIELELRTNQKYSIPHRYGANKFLSNHTMHELLFGSSVYDTARVTIDYDGGFLGKRYTGEDVTNEELRKKFMEYISRSLENVYFISNGHHIKIGRTNNLQNRLANLQTSSSFALEVVAAIETDNSVALEAMVHDHFKERRINGEWFDIDELDVVRYIDSLEVNKEDERHE